MTILDRMLFVSFVRAFLICLTSTLSLYVIVDMFTNLDDFASKSGGFVGTLKNISNYYGYRVIQYYDRLCEVISLLAGMFTVAWLQRSNELLPILSAGVSTRRVLRPILFGAVVVLAIGVVNQEVVIPRIASVLMSDRDDHDGDKEKLAQGAFDPTGIHVEGVVALRKEQAVRTFFVTLPETRTSNMFHLSAGRGTYIAPSNEPLSGGWLLTDTVPAELDPSQRSEFVTVVDRGKYFVKTREVNFDSVCRDPKWFMYASASRLYELLNRPDAPRQGPVAVMFHMKLTRPIIGMILVVMGLSLILRDQTRHVFISAGMCLGMCALFYGVVFTCRFLGNADYLAPALAAWLPVMIFGPISFALFDAIHT